MLSPPTDGHKSAWGVAGDGEEPSCSREGVGFAALCSSWQCPGNGPCSTCMPHLHSHPHLVPEHLPPHQLSPTVKLQSTLFELGNQQCGSHVSDDRK